MSFHPSTSFYPSSSSPERDFNFSPLSSLERGNSDKILRILVSSVILSGWTFFLYSLKIIFFSSSCLVVETDEVIKDTHHVILTFKRSILRHPQSICSTTIFKMSFLLHQYKQKFELQKNLINIINYTWNKILSMNFQF